LETLLYYGKENNYKADDIVSKLEELAAQADIQKVLEDLAEISSKKICHGKDCKRFFQ
jgi:hypothetical protein